MGTLPRVPCLLTAALPNAPPNPIPNHNLVFVFLLLLTIDSIMVIVPVSFARLGKIYIGLNATTSHQNKRIFVGTDYRKRTAPEVISQAFVNAIIRQDIRKIADKMSAGV